MERREEKISGGIKKDSTNEEKNPQTNPKKN